MSQNRKIKRRLRVDRIAGAVVIVVILFYFLANVGSCSKGGSDPAVPTDNNVSETTQQVSETSEEDTQLIVCIDAGHGGNDPGSLAQYTTRYEKNDNLAIALSVQKYLQQRQNDVNLKIIMTRSDDTFVSLDDRCTIANLAKADLFVSLHRNSASGANGVEVWVHNEEPQPDCRLAYNILVNLDKAGISKNKGVRFGYISDPNENYQVNRETDMPSCLVELGFMDSVEDNTLFDDNLDKYGEAIADAIIQTAKELGLKGLESDVVQPIETDYYNYDVSDYIPDPSVGEH